MKFRLLLATLLASLLAPPHVGRPLVSPALAQSTVAQTLLDFAFDPLELSVPVGTTLLWTNIGPTEHTVADNDVTWSSDILQPGDSYSHTFDAPGKYLVICSLHPEMETTISVE